MLRNSTIEISRASERGNGKEATVAKLLDDYLTALEAGAPCDVEQLVSEYPDLAEDIRTFSKSVSALHMAAKSLRGDEMLSAGGRQSKVLGDFELGPEIGRGGMGVVYKARQTSLDRQVALKVLPFAAMWNEKQVARFRNEAQAAAQLHHPNIVPVFAVGQERGMHFYAMQFVDGRSLDEVIGELQSLGDIPTSSKSSSAAADSTVVAAATHGSANTASDLSHEYSKSRIEYCRTIAKLGIQAAEAVHYAHEYGVIHRDVKPSNLLLDNFGKLWITDFGLARVQNSPGVTITGDVVGTLRYMSPEQSTGQHALVDQRTDVYALGATLYELLTLQAAFPGEERHSVLRAIESTEPTPLRSINSAVPVDLETIIQQAMAKSRENRYSTAQELADDLGRFLQGKPTVARKPTLIDRSVKWLKRHRIVAAAATLTLLLVTSVSTVAAVLLAHKTAQKDAALLTSKQNLKHARQVVDRFGIHFSRELERLPGSEPLRQELLRDTLAYYKEFIANAAGDDQLETEAAATAFKAAGIANRLGMTEEARSLFERALQVFEQADREGDFIQQRAVCLHELGQLEAAQGHIQSANQKFHLAASLQEQLVESSDDKSEASRNLAEMLMNQGLFERHTGNSAEAVDTLERAIAILETLADQEPADLRHRHDLGIALNNLSFVQQESDWLAARDSCQRAIEVLSHLREEPASQNGRSPALEQDVQSDLALCYNNLGAIESHMQRHQQACALHRQAIEQQEQLRRQSPAIVDHRGHLAVSWNNLGQALAQAGNADESNEAFQRAREILVELTQDFPAEIAFRSSLAGVLNNQAMSLEHAGSIEPALELYESAVSHQKFAADQAPQLVAFRENLSKHYVNYGRALRKLNRPAEAAQAARERRELWSHDGKQLYHVARELALAAGQLPVTDDQASQRQSIAEEALSTLQQALTAAHRPRQQPIDPADFPAISDHHQFQDLLSESQ